MLDALEYRRTECVLKKAIRNCESLEQLAGKRWLEIYCDIDSDQKSGRGRKKETKTQ